MIRKKIFTLLTAVFMVLAFSTMAIAANQVVLKTTVPNIPKSTCYQAGTDTMEMDHLTKMAEGDVIQFTLNNKVTVCKSLDFFVSLGTGALGTGADLAVSASNVLDVLTYVGLVGGNDMGFVVKATNGDSPANQIITLTLRQRVIGTGALVALNTANTMQFNAAAGDPANDRLIVKLFDGKTTAAQLFKDDPAVAGVEYDTALVLTDNILCIDTLTQDYMDEYVQNTPDSLPGLPADKLNFSGDYRIAHIMATVIESLVPCGGKAVGHIEIGAQGQPDTCESFDFETAGTVAGNGYCNDHQANNKLIIASSGTFVAAADYVAKMQIIVERSGVAKAIPGVYWSNVPVNYATDTFANICGNLAGFAAPGGETYLRSNGTTAATAPRPPATANCDLTADEKAVYLTTGATIAIPAATQYLTIDLPDFNYDPDEVLVGDVVKIKVTLTSGCTSIGPLTITIGTFGCGLAPIVGSMAACPYVTTLAAWDPAADGTFWNGIAITNYNNAAGTVVLTAYKQDGTTATVTIPILANGMVVNYVSALGWTGTTPDGVPAWIKLESADIPAGFLDAFIMMSDNTTQSMGYLCR